MNFKKSLLILMCTLTLVGCGSSKENNKKEETKPKTESTEKKDDNKIKEETKKEETQKNTVNEDKENVSQQETVAVENKQQTITEEKTSNEDVSKPKNEAITEESAKELIKVADSKFVEQNLNSGYFIEKVEYAPSTGWCDVSKYWDIPQEEFIYFTLKNDSHSIRNYVVGMSSKNVYSISTQGGVPAYVMENGERVKEYKWKE